MNKFSDRLRDLRIEKRLSQDDLAREVGLSQGAIALWENNQRIPKLDAVILLAKYFDVSLDYIAGMED